MPNLMRITLLSLVTMLIGCRSARQESAQIQPRETGAGRIYVTNEVSGDLTVIDAGSLDTLSVVPLGKRPRGIHSSPDHKFIYVALSGSPIAGPGVDENTLPPPDRSADGIGVFDVHANKLVRTISAGADPENFDVSPDGKYIYVSNEDTSAVSMIDISAGQVAKSFPVGAEPEGVKITPDARLVYITSEEAGKLYILDPVKGKIIGNIQVGHRPRSIAFMPNGKIAYVNAENDGNVVIVDTVKRKMVGTIPIGTPGQVKPMALLLSADAKTLYVSTGRGQQVFTIDIATNKVLRSVQVGKRPWGIGVSYDGRTLYSANGPSNDVSVVDLATNSVAHRIKVGSSPWGIAVLDAPGDH